MTSVAKTLKKWSLKWRKTFEEKSNSFLDTVQGDPSSLARWFYMQEETADSNKTETPSDKKDEGSVVAVQAQDDTQSTGKQTANADTTVTPEVKKTGKVVPKKQSKTPMPEKRDNADTSKTETKSDKDDKKEERGGTGEKSGAKTDKQKASDVSNVKGKVKEGDKSKDEKVTKERDGKDEGFKSKSSKEVKDKRKSDEPPRHPGFILQTKWTKDSKVCYL